MVCVQALVRESCPCLAHCLVLLIFGIIDGQEECAKSTVALALAIEGPDRYHIDAVAHAINVVLLQLQPVDGPLGRHVGCIIVQRLEHEALARACNRLIQKCLNLILLQFIKVAPDSVHYLALVLMEHTPQPCAPRLQVLGEVGLAIVEHAVKRHDTHLDFDVLDVDVLSGAGGKDLERQDLLVCQVIGDDLAVNDPALHVIGKSFLDHLDHVGVLLCHVFGVSAVDFDSAAVYDVNLRALPVILPLSREPLAR
mmetsp:Transcript_6017/g.14356  ORF Transcript_6017/g.14356 Transcript_6017/m.14356 type:complete len:254 (+) Transcript_6017:402-1163(+)